MDTRTHHLKDISPTKWNVQGSVPCGAQFFKFSSSGIVSTRFGIRETIDFNVCVYIRLEINFLIEEYFTYDKIEVIKSITFNIHSMGLT